MPTLIRAFALAALVAFAARPSAELVIDPVAVVQVDHGAPSSPAPAPHAPLALVVTALVVGPAPTELASRIFVSAPAPARAPIARPTARGPPA